MSVEDFRHSSKVFACFSISMSFYVGRGNRTYSILTANKREAQGFAKCMYVFIHSGGCSGCYSRLQLFPVKVLGWRENWDHPH